MKALFLATLIFGLSNVVFSQTFSLLSFNTLPLRYEDGHLRKNAVLSDGKIYYSSIAPGYATGYLAVVNPDGTGAKVFTTAVMEGANFLMATEKFIYYNSYISKEDVYYLYRFNKQTEQVELVTNAESGKPWIFNTSYPGVSRMYGYKNKLVLAGKFKTNSTSDSRSLSVIEDDAPKAYYLSANLNLYGSDGLSVSLVPRPDEVAIGDSLIAFYEKNEQSVRSLIFSSSGYKSGEKIYYRKGMLDFDKFDYSSYQDKVVCSHNIFYFLYTKKSKTKGDLTTYLMQYDGAKFTNLASLNSEPFGVFMKVVGDDIFMGDITHMYKYNIKTKAMTNLITLTKGSLAMIQEQEMLLTAPDGTIFLAIDQRNEKEFSGKFGFRTIIAIDSKQHTDTITTVDPVDMNRPYDSPEHKSVYILGNDLYQEVFDSKKSLFLKMYSKQNGWIPKLIELPVVQKYYSNPLGTNTLIQLPESILLQPDYLDKKKKNFKRILLNLGN